MAPACSQECSCLYCRACTCAQVSDGVYGSGVANVSCTMAATFLVVNTTRPAGTPPAGYQVGICNHSDAKVWTRVAVVRLPCFLVVRAVGIMPCF